MKAEYSFHAAQFFTATIYECLPDPTGSAPLFKDDHLIISICWPLHN